LDRWAVHNRLSILGKSGQVAGCIDTDKPCSIAEGAVEIMVLSRTTFSQDIALDPAVENGLLVQPPSIDSYLEPNEPDNIYKERWRKRHHGTTHLPHGCDYFVFEPLHYSMYKPWPLYNVMLLEWENGVAYRVALGRVHVDAFWEARPRRSLIVLG
jgi:hypothetical protein